MANCTTNTRREQKRGSSDFGDFNAREKRGNSIQAKQGQESGGSGGSIQSQTPSGLRNQHDSRLVKKDPGSQPGPELESLPGFLGTQILAEYYGCDTTALSDSSLVEEIMVAAARDAGATVVSTSFHQFSPHGVSGVVIIEESHLGIHTWPEFGFAAVDLFTCGDSVNPWKAYESLKSSFKAHQGTFMELRRGHRSLIENS